MHGFQYKTLENLDSIRILELQPGTDLDGDVHVVLRDGRLSDMPSCEAISYEWGEAVYKRYIMCEGHRLEVTANLYDVLWRLRPSKESRLLWADAVCINQESPDERTQQVGLMAEIFRTAKQVIIWIGEESAYTGFGIKLMQHFARIIEASELFPATSQLKYGHYKDLDIPEALHLHGAFLQSPAWRGLCDIWGSHRGYWKRLWVVQEIVLSTRASVVCGSHAVAWETVASVAHLLQALGYTEMVTFGYGNKPNNRSLVCQIATLRQHFSSTDSDLMLDDLIAFTDQANCCDGRDRIFGIIGMLSPRNQMMATSLKYDMTPGEVFHIGTSMIIRQSRSLRFWSGYDILPDAYQETSTPSWVPYPDLKRFTSTIGRNLPYVSEEPGPRIAAATPGTLTVWGFVLDTVQTCSRNFSAENLQQQILEALEYIAEARRQGQLLSRTSTSALWKTLLMFVKGTYPYDVHEAGLDQWMTQYSLYSRLSQSTTSPKSHLQTKGKGQALPTIGGVSFSSGSALGPISFSCLRPPFTDPVIRALLGHIESELGRNLFLTTQGRFGVGPASLNGHKSQAVLADKAPILERNATRLIAPAQDDTPRKVDLKKTTVSGHRLEALNPAVKAGDVIVILASAVAPVVLRSLGDGSFSYVGQAYIGLLDEEAHLRKGRMVVMKPMYIR